MRSILISIPLLVFGACSDPGPSSAAPPAGATEVAAAPVRDETADPAIPDPAPGTEPDAPPFVISPVDVPDLIDGKWKSIDDPSAMITVTGDGTWSDGTGEPGAWQAMFGSAARAADPSMTFTPKATYLQVKMGDHTFWYELGAVDEENLELFYAGRGNRLAYKRVK